MTYLLVILYGHQFSLLCVLQAAAANKRLKEALARQKAVLNERNAKMETCDSTSIGNRVRVSCPVFGPLSFFCPCSYDEPFVVLFIFTLHESK